MPKPSFRIPFAASLLATTLSAALASQTPVDTAAAIHAADSAAHAWLALVDKGQIAESWDEAALSFQIAVTKPKWEQAVKKARGSFEPFGARRQIMARYRTDLPNAPPGQYVVFQYETTVAGDRQVVETVVPMLDRKRGWRISGYFIRLDE
ncbi:MAG TPA: DUF4019 domain-containing protein [Gemmatimonadales bacterium]|nr:DUF4019 domain-containing protein [Gemmatimonadales bacterium]